MRRTLRWGVQIVVVVLAVIYVAISYLVAAGVTKAERKEQEDQPDRIRSPVRRGGVRLAKGRRHPEGLVHAGCRPEADANLCSRHRLDPYRG